MPKLARHYGEPYADPSCIPSFYLAELTRRHVTVALNGDGGDESFAGYGRYVAIDLSRRLERLPRPARRLVAGAAGLVPQTRNPSSNFNRGLRLAQSLTREPVTRYMRHVHYFDPTERELLYTDDYKELVAD